MSLSKSHPEESGPFSGGGLGVVRSGSLLQARLAARTVCRILLTAKGLIALIVLASVFAASFNVAQFNSAYARWADATKPVVAHRFSTWDIAHYLALSQSGYEAGSHSCAFYPLWPAAIKVASDLSGGNKVLVSTLLANSLSLAALWLFFRLVAQRYGSTLSRDALVLMLAFPGALFFCFAYSESLFLLILMIFFLSLETGRWWWVAATCLLLPLGRPVGLFILLPLAWHLHQHPKAKHAAKGRRQKTDQRPELRAQACEINVCEGHAIWTSGARWLLLLVPLLGYGSYFGLMYLWTGNAFEGFDAQEAYPNSPSIKNMFNIAGFWNALTNIGSLDGMMDSLLDRAFFLLVLVLLPFVWRLDRTWFWYTLPAGIVPALTSWFMSYRRYIMVLFPIFVVLAQLLARTKSRWLFWYYVILLAALQAWAVKQFVNFNWAG